MAIDTVNKKLAVIEMDDYWEPALPISPGVLGQDDQQQLLWGYPGVLWEEASVSAIGHNNLQPYVVVYIWQRTG